MKCKYCGEEIQQPKRGRRIYCNKPECRRKATNEYQRKWYAQKMQQTLKGTRSRVVEQQEKKVITYQTGKTVNKKVKKTAVDNATELLELAREFSALRYKVKEYMEKKGEEVKAHNLTTGSTFFHELELMSDQEFLSMSGKKAKKMMNREREALKSRRLNKNEYHIARAMYESILMKNPSQFVVQAIQGGTDTEKTIEKLKKNNKLYGQIIIPKSVGGEIR